MSQPTGIFVVLDLATREGQVMLNVAHVVSVVAGKEPNTLQVETSTCGPEQLCSWEVKGTIEAFADLISRNR